MTDQLRYQVHLKLNPLDQSSRVSMGGNDRDALVAKIAGEQRDGEIILLVDYETGERVAVGADGARVGL